MVCLEPVLDHHRSQARLCRGQIWGLASLLTAFEPPAHHPIFQLASSCPAPRPRGTFTLFPHISSLLHHGPWQGLGRGQPGPALWCPLCHCLSLIALLLTRWLAGGKLCRKPALFGSPTRGVVTLQRVVITSLLLFFVIHPALFLCGLTVNNNAKR